MHVFGGTTFHAWYLTYLNHTSIEADLNSLEITVEPSKVPTAMNDKEYVHKMLTIYRCIKHVKDPRS